MQNFDDFTNNLSDMETAKIFSAMLCKYDTETLLSIIGTVCDAYSYVHPEFNTAESLAVLSVCARTKQEIFHS